MYVPYSNPRELALAKASQLEAEAAAIRQSYSTDERTDLDRENDEKEFVDYVLAETVIYLGNAPMIHKWGDGNFGYIIDRFTKMIRGEGL